MTGYGKSVLQLPTKKITIEIKSLNSKSLDLNTRMPSVYREKELDIRKLIASKLERGKVDFSIFVEITGEETTTQINTSAVKQYIKQLKEIVDGDDTELLKMAVRFPDALNTERTDIDEDEWKAVLNEINAALNNIAVYRLDEGKVLEQDFKDRVQSISTLLDDVIAIDPERVIAVRERLLKGVEEL